MIINQPLNTMLLKLQDFIKINIVNIISLNNSNFDKIGDYSSDKEAYDNAGLIAKGTHQRFSVKIEKFLAKAEERLKK